MVNKFIYLSMLVIVSLYLASPVEASTKAVISPPSLFKDPSTGIELLFVKGGCYQMGNIYSDGDSAEKPAHEVCVNDFFIGKYEVRQDQWIKIMGNNPSIDNGCGDDCPVENVSWNDVQDFITILNGKDGGSRYRLPTEAEFEYAQRSGGKSERYSGGNDVDSVAWYSANTQEVNPVGRKAPNGFGLYDMSGNVWEWTGDYYDSNYYSVSPRNNPAGPASGVQRSKRGGCYSGSSANQRVSRREGEIPELRASHIGFRLVRTP